MCVCAWKQFYKYSHPQTTIILCVWNAPNLIQKANVIHHLSAGTIVCVRHPAVAVSVVIFRVILLEASVTVKAQSDTQRLTHGKSHIEHIEAQKMSTVQRPVINGWETYLKVYSDKVTFIVLCILVAQFVTQRRTRFHARVFGINRDPTKDITQFQTVGKCLQMHTWRHYVSLLFSGWGEDKCNGGLIRWNSFEQILNVVKVKNSWFRCQMTSPKYHQPFWCSAK